MSNQDTTEGACPPMNCSPFVAAEWRTTTYGKTCYCNESKMPRCKFYEAGKLEGMCRHNFDPRELDGSPDEITDCCFHAKARSIAANA